MDTKIDKEIFDKSAFNAIEKASAVENIETEKDKDMKSYLHFSWGMGGLIVIFGVLIILSLIGWLFDIGVVINII